MANVIVEVFYKSGRALSFFSVIASKLMPLRRAFYTGMKSKGFKSFGKSSRIQPKFQSLVGEKYISVGEKCHLGQNMQLTAWDSYEDRRFTPEIIIGNNTQIGDDSHITAINRIIIGKNVLTGKRILITDNSHGASQRDILDVAPTKRELYSKGPVIIDDNVWIGEKASIMPGVHIGKGAIIAANAVVSHDVPEYCVAAGAPAKIIKNLNDTP